jgi:hypothetical protein
VVGLTCGMNDIEVAKYLLLIKLNKVFPKQESEIQDIPCVFPTYSGSHFDGGLNENHN